jgi:hypothetical protein
MVHPLDSARARLKRADENIRNLELEVRRFFRKSDYTLIKNEDDELFLKAVEYHGRREIPLRFAVLVGEVFHHFRSTMDHVAWQLSTPAAQNAHSIEFPIFLNRPITPKELSRYERKIKGIASPSARKRIEQLQPYNARVPLDDPLWIIHDMNRIDKHRELLLVTTMFNIKLSRPELIAFVLGYRSGDASAITPEIARAFKKDVKVTPHIAFARFGNRENESLVPALSQLAKRTAAVVDSFESEFR